MTANYLLRNPQVFAEKCNLKSRADTALKGNPTKEALIELLKTECVESATTPKKRVVRNINSMLDSSDSDELPPVPEKKKKKKKLNIAAKKAKIL